MTLNKNVRLSCFDFLLISFDGLPVVFKGKKRRYKERGGFKKECVREKKKIKKGKSKFFSATGKTAHVIYHQLSFRRKRKKNWLIAQETEWERYFSVFVSKFFFLKDHRKKHTTSIVHFISFQFNSTNVLSSLLYHVVWCSFNRKHSNAHLPSPHHTAHLLRRSFA